MIYRTFLWARNKANIDDNLTYVTFLPPNKQQKVFKLRTSSRTK